MTGRLYGVGVGPGDPELITLKAAKLITEADVVAYHSGTAGRSIARTIADALIRDETIEELLIYPVTTGTTGHPLGYYGAVEDFYDESAERLEKHLDAGRTVVVLAEGDPLFYSSYMYLHDRLADRYPSELVPGVTSISAAASAIATPLARHEDILTVLPGTLPVPELARRLADTDAAAIMKLGRTFAGVREALRQAGRLDDATYVERASTGEQRTLPVAEVDPAEVPYFSMIIVPGRDRRLDSAGRATAGRTEEAAARPSAANCSSSDSVPGPDRWLTPEVAEVLAAVDHVVGYAPYVDRVPQRAGLQRHASGNTVEIDRARHALDLAREGERVAVVSGGDAGRLRHGLGRLRGRGSRALRRGGDHRAARSHRGAGRGRQGRRAAGRRLRRALAVGSAEAVGGDRAAAPRRCGGGPGAGDLQPGLPFPARPDPPRPRHPARDPRSPDPGRRRPPRRPAGGGSSA